MFDEQTSFNLCAKIVLDRAFSNIGGRKSKGGNIKLPIDPGFNFVTKKNKMSTSFVITKEGNTSKVTWKSKKGNEPKRNYSDEVLKSVCSRCFSNGSGITSLQGFTTLDWNGKIIRAHPYYNKTEWFDFVSLEWEGECNKTRFNYICPSKVYMFLNIENHPNFAINGIYAIVHSTAFNERTKKPMKAALDKWEERGKPSLCTFWTMENEDAGLHCIPVSFFKHVSFVYSDFSDEEMTVKTDLVIEMKGLAEWENVHNLNN